MFWKIALFILAASAFGFVPYADSFALPFSALLPLVLCLALAMAASAGFSALAAAFGALAALFSALLWPVLPWASGALLSAFVFAERSARVRNRKARFAHVGVALLVGAASALIVQHYFLRAGSAHSWMVSGISLVIVAVLMQLPTLIEADDSMAHALSSCALWVSGPARESLLLGADLRRAAVDVSLCGRDAREAKNAWKTLVELGEARVRMERVVAPLHGGPALGGAGRVPEKGESRAFLVARKLDGRIAEHVAGLGRLLSAADSAAAVVVGLNDSALRHVEGVGESLDDVTKVLVDDI